MTLEEFLDRCAEQEPDWCFEHSNRLASQMLAIIRVQAEALELLRHENKFYNHCCGCNMENITHADSGKTFYELAQDAQKSVEEILNGK